MNKFALSTASALLAATALADNPVLSHVTWTPRPGKAIISFTLENDPAVVTLDVYTNGVRVATSAVKSVTDTRQPNLAAPAVNCAMATGDHRLEWNAIDDLPEMTFENGEVSIDLKAWSLAAPPDYMLVDLANVTNVHYYASTDALPYPLVTGDEAAIPANDPLRTTHLLMRKIEAAGVKWRKGSADVESSLQTKTDARLNNEWPHFVTLTKDYYIAVFEMTQAQYETVCGNNPSSFVDPALYPNAAYQPVEYLSYNTLRGINYQACVVGSEVKSKSFVDLLRKRTGLVADLPSDAQWEFACRAGTDTFYNNGENTSSHLGQIAWYNGNGQGKTHPVGLKAGNAWGLYDMHGNVFEIVLDGYDGNVAKKSAPEIDPPLGYHESKMAAKGGSYNYADGAATSSVIRGDLIDYGSRSQMVGFRVAAPIPVPVY